jgi:hypothetical protein
MRVESRIFEVKADDTIYRRYLYEGRTYKVVEYEGECRVWSNRDLAVHRGSEVSNGTQSEEGKNAKASDYRNIGIIRRVSTKELWFKNEGSEAKALIKRWVGWIDLDGQL